MTRIAFRMQLKKGYAEEYRRRHDEIWPELVSLLREAGISEYSIFLEEESFCLFAVLKTANTDAVSNISEKPVMKKWWAYMKDIMDTNPDDSPVSIPLKEVFFLP